MATLKFRHNFIVFSLIKHIKSATVLLECNFEIYDLFVFSFLTQENAK